MALQTEFYTDISKFEPIVWAGLTKKQIKTALCTIPSVIVIGLEVVFIQGFMFWIVAILTAAVLAAPPILWASGKLEQIKAYIEYDIKIQDRYYAVGQIRKYEPDEFIAKDNVSELQKF